MMHPDLLRHAWDQETDPATGSRPTGKPADGQPVEMLAVLGHELRAPWPRFGAPLKFYA